ncbi:MAG: 4-hydroxy-tetrahydrodipicolinate synthase [Acetobacterium sp.]|nr:4-hydroxy-tetrahydrodipicolinate synthase [Acetobacterium sp.]
MSIFSGRCVALVTPFTHGKVDLEGFHNLIDWQIEQKTVAILIAGTTGETSTLTDDEHLELLRDAGKYINGRVPFVAGTGSNDTAYSIMLSKEAEQAGADAALIINPYYNKSTQRGIIAHISAIANAITIPVIIYNVPSRTGLNIEVSTIKELSKIANVAAVKEASGDISQVTEIARVCGDDIDIYSGNDDHLLPILSVGGKGVISVSANIIPAEMHELVTSFMAGDLKRARELQFSTNLVNRAMFYETNPIPIKTAMALMGLDSGEMRLPLIEMEESNKAKLIADLKTYGLL